MCNVKEAVKLSAGLSSSAHVPPAGAIRPSYRLVHILRYIHAIVARLSMPPYAYPDITGMRARPRLSELVREAAAVRRVASPIAWL
jgi:hypothetical protein